MADGNGNQSGNGDEGVDATRLFRTEAVVSDVDLRIDVAGRIERTINADEDVELQEMSTHTRGGLAMLRGSRDVQVAGDITRHTDSDETLAVTNGSIEERVLGGVEYHTSVEGEAIVGGAYAGTVTGPFLRVAAWSDFLCWGGWIEADVSRTEISSMMIRALNFYSHAAGARVTMAYNLVDDFVLRFESWGVLVDNTTTAVNLGAPGAGVELEA